MVDIDWLLLLHASGHGSGAPGREQWRAGGHEARTSSTKQAARACCMMAVIAAGPGLGGHNPSYEACGGRAAT